MSLSKIFGDLDLEARKQKTVTKPAPFQSDVTVDEALACIEDLCRTNRRFVNRLILTIGLGDWRRDEFVSKLSTKLGKRLFVCSADDYFMKDGKYKFDATNLKWAHQQCQGKVCNALIARSRVVLVANTNVYTDHINMYNKFKEDMILVQFIPTSLNSAVKMGEGNSKRIPASVFEKSYQAMQSMDIHPEILPRMAALLRISVGESYEVDNEKDVDSDEGDEKDVDSEKEEAEETVNLS